MRYRWRDLPALARTPVGRSQIRRRLRRGLWPVLSRLVRLRRRATGRRVVAVVGSFGKTSTARTVSAALGLEPPPNGANAYSAIALRLLRPDSDARHAVAEVGITHPGQMAEYARAVRPDITVVTAIGNSHLDRLATLDNVAHEKADMVRVVPDTGRVVLNGDDPRVRAMATQTGARVVTYGLGRDNDVRGLDVRVDPDEGTFFTVAIDGSRHPARLRLLGEPAVYAALAAVAVGHAEGRPTEEILAALASLAPASGRLEIEGLPGGIRVLRDDNKSSVDAIYKALDVFEDMSARRRVAVVHEPVDEVRPDGVVFPSLGARLADVADRLLFLGTARRFAELVNGAGSGVAESRAWERYDSDATEVAAALGRLLEEGDAVLLKGPRTARLDRVVHALRGRTVRCRAASCDALIDCGVCPMLESGWGNRRIVI